MSSQTSCDFGLLDLTVRDLVCANGFSSKPGVLSKQRLGNTCDLGEQWVPALSKLWPLFIFSFSHFEADQAPRVRSWLPGSYQLDRFCPALRTFGERSAAFAAEGVECNEQEGDRGCPSCFQGLWAPLQPPCQTHTSVWLLGTKWSLMQGNWLAGARRVRSQAKG